MDKIVCILLILLLLCIMYYTFDCGCSKVINGFSVGCQTGPVMCDPNANPPEKCPGNIKCPQCGNPECLCPTSPGPSPAPSPTPSCENELNKLCGQTKGDPFRCASCAGDNQEQLHTAGCTNDKIAQWCAGESPSPSPPSSDICNNLNPTTCLSSTGNCVNIQPEAKANCNNNLTKEQCNSAEYSDFKWCSNGPFRNKLENSHNYTIDVWNNTDKLIFVLVNVREPGYNNNFENLWSPYIFNIGKNNDTEWKTSVNTIGTKTTKTKTTNDDKGVIHYIYTLNKNQSLRFKSNTNNNKWTSGNISVLSDDTVLDNRSDIL